MTLKRHSL